MIKATESAPHITDVIEQTLLAVGCACLSCQFSLTACEPHRTAISSKITNTIQLALLSFKTFPYLKRAPSLTVQLSNESDKC